MADENEKAEHSDEANKGNESKEYERWKDYANALLLAFSILFAGAAIGVHKEPWSYLSGVSGIVGIICVLAFYARDPPWQWCNRPGFLVVASICLGAQAAYLIPLL